VPQGERIDEELRAPCERGARKAECETSRRLTADGWSLKLASAFGNQEIQKNKAAELRDIGGHCLGERPK
jgi:hypothetical protein